MKLFEYLACERPVLSVRLAGIQSVAKNTIFYADTSSEFAEKLAYILKNPQKIRDKIITGNVLVNKFGWDNLANEYGQVLKQVHLKFLDKRKSKEINF
jgi:glycosyltransferase involved in cell wall biosynthesis